MFNKSNMAKMLKQAQDVQKKIENVQSELEEMHIEAESGGGMVKIVVNGKMEVLELILDNGILNEDKDMIEDLIISAINKALNKAQEESQLRMNSVTGGMLSGMKIPI